MATGTLSPDERAARGKAARGQASRSSHAAWQAPADRRSPIGILDEQARSRVPELVPIRYGRMIESPFAYFRGAAAPMAEDLSRTPASGLRVQLCGDAHLSNFGGFASPDRDLVFDLNDFELMTPERMVGYAEMCGWTLARAHARSGDRIAIGAYLGKGDAFDRAMVRFARAYADQNERDHEALVGAVRDGTLPAERGV
jgi:hypothetical protein